MRETVQEADLPELAELGGGHGLEGFTGDAHVIPDRDGQVGIGAVAVLHCEGSLLLLCLHQPIKESSFRTLSQHGRKAFSKPDASQSNI